MNKLTKTIASSIIEQIKKQNYDSKKLIFVCGVMGSGKTTFIKNMLLTKSNKSYYSSIDEVIPFFRDIGMTDSREIYRECRKVGIEVTNYLMENNISMIIEGTGANRDIIDYIQKLKSKNYYIKTYFIKTQLEMCRQRVRERNKTSNHIVLDKDVIEYHNKLWNSNIGQIITELSDKTIIIPEMKIGHLINQNCEDDKLEILEI